MSVSVTSQWSDQEAETYIERYAQWPADVALRVYTSRLIGGDPNLVLHGGGNTSVKTRLREDTGQEIDVLCVKGSGWNLADIEPQGLPALRLAQLLALYNCESLSDEAMVNAQRTRLLDSSSPDPSVETLLHAFLPHKFIDHSHADAILALVDQPHAEALCRARFGSRFGIVPYVMPGFALSKLAARVYREKPDVEGLLLLKHGLFTFGETARESYERHIEAVAAARKSVQIALSEGGRERDWPARIAEDAPNTQHASRSTDANGTHKPSFDALTSARETRFAALGPMLRSLLGEGERRYTLHLRYSPVIAEFLAHPRLDTLSQVGCATPDHVIRTKRFPLVLRLDPLRDPQEQREAIAAHLDDYRAHYKQYVERQRARVAQRIQPLDPDPRVLLVPGVGLITVGSTLKAARIAADIYEHTLGVIRDAETLGRYEALPEEDIFDMEYWSLEQKKLGKSKARPLEGRVVLITGAASGIGAAVAQRFASEGAQLYLVDRDAEALPQLAAALGAAHEVLDVADETALRGSVTRCVLHYGGLDGVVSNAGIAPQAKIAECSTEQLDHSFRVNLFSHHWLASAAVGVMQAQGRSFGGFLLFNASKAAWNPGPDFGPYAIPKAALLALMKQYALETAALSIRANAVNADRVRTQLLNSADIAARAQARGLSPDAYYRSNLLAREVTPDDVAAAFLHLALAPSTTGSVLTVDGGNIAASPR